MLRIVLYTIPWRRTKAYRVFLRELKLMFERYNIEIPYNTIVAYNARYASPVMIADNADDEPENSAEESPSEVSALEPPKKE